MNTIAKNRNPYLHEFGKAWVKKAQRQIVTDQDHLMEAAQEFGLLCANGEKSGLSVPVAFELAREHFKRHGKAMIEIADAITLEMIEKVSAEKRK